MALSKLSTYYYKLNTHSVFFHTYYSFKYGTFEPRQLLQMAVDGGFSAIAIADINNTSAVLNSLRMAQKMPLHVVPGIDFRAGAKPLFIGLARNNEGFRQLNELLTAHLHSGEPLPDTQASRKGMSACLRNASIASAGHALLGRINRRSITT